MLLVLCSLVPLDGATAGPEGKGYTLPLEVGPGEPWGAVKARLAAAIGCEEARFTLFLPREGARQPVGDLKPLSCTPGSSLAWS